MDTRGIFADCSLSADGPAPRLNRSIQVPTVALESCRERCTPKGLLPATEPLHEDGLDLLFGGPKANLGIIPALEKVHTRDNVCTTIPPTLEAVKPIPMPVVLVDGPARRIRTGLTGVCSIDGFKAGTSRLRAKLQPVFKGGSSPPREFAILGAPSHVRQVFHHDDRGTRGERLTHRLTHDRPDGGLIRGALLCKLLAAQVVPSDPGRFCTIPLRFGFRG